MNENSLRWCVAVVIGIAATVLTRSLLLVATAPNSLIIYSLRYWWHLPLAVLIGLGVTGACLFTRRRFPVFIAGLLLIASAASHWLVFNVPVMNRLDPGFWVK